ncbi:MAG: GNAT family N-acetyltransferase [Fusicatenibacter sp.]
MEKHMENHQKFKLAMVQHAPGIYKKKENTDLAISFLRKAKEEGADLVLFPECWITSYEFPAICEELLPVEELEQVEEFRSWKEQAITEEDPFLQRICQAAKEYEIGVCITSFTKGENAPRNTAFVIDRDGRILMSYSKVHTCDFSVERYLESGEAFHVCTFDGIRIGVMICYDREYPESARELMLQGAELILVPNCCDDMKMRLRELSVRAMENLCVVAMANPPGENSGCSCAFHPMVWDYEDNLIVAADPLYDGLVYAEFDMDEIRAYNGREDIGKYRKPAAYRHRVQEKKVHIRFVTEEDAGALLAIYAPYVEQTAITFEYEVPSKEEFTERIRRVQKRYPYLAAESEGEILGYAYVSPFRSRAAYDWAVETSIYVRMDQKRRGIGKLLCQAMERILKLQNILNLEASIGYPVCEDEYLTLDSVRFHERLGYRMVGRFSGCGYKYNRWYDMVWMEKRIGEHTAHPLPVKSVLEIREDAERILEEIND